MYNTIIVGARSAGAALALMLARRGHKVLMLDRATFPSDTMSGHYIHPAGVAWLKRWGVFDRLAATDTPPQQQMTVDFGPIALTGTPAPMGDGTTTGYAPRRWLFDPLLATAASEAGATFWQGVTMRRPLFERGNVVGIEAVTSAGAPVELRAPLVVGADGKRSRLARQVGAGFSRHHQGTTCTFYAYWRGFDAGHTHLFVRDGRTVIVAPTNGDETFIGVIWPVAAFKTVRAALERQYLTELECLPWIAARLPVAERASQFIGTSDLDGFLRRSHGPGWALVGDAGCHLDPITAQGMTNAFLHAELLADAVDAGLRGSCPMASALARYERLRDAHVMPMFDLTADMAQLRPPPPEMAAHIGAMAGNATATAAFLGVMAGSVPVEQVFPPVDRQQVA